MLQNIFMYNKHIVQCLKKKKIRHFYLIELKPLALAQ